MRTLYASNFFGARGDYFRLWTRLFMGRGGFLRLWTRLFMGPEKLPRTGVYGGEEKNYFIFVLVYRHVPYFLTCPSECATVLVGSFVEGMGGVTPCFGMPGHPLTCASSPHIHGSPGWFTPPALRFPQTGPPLKMSAGTLNFARFARANGAHYIKKN